jgi:hypothetical protein
MRRRYWRELNTSARIRPAQGESKMKWCDACARNVTPQKDFNWLVFIFLCGICYLPFYLSQAPHCPICKGKSFSPAR